MKTYTCIRPCTLKVPHPLNPSIDHYRKFEYGDELLLDDEDKCPKYFKLKEVITEDVNVPSETLAAYVTKVEELKQLVNSLQGQLASVAPKPVITDEMIEATLKTHTRAQMFEDLHKAEVKTFKGWNDNDLAKKYIESGLVK